MTIHDNDFGGPSCGPRTQCNCAFCTCLWLGAGTLVGGWSDPSGHFLYGDVRTADCAGAAARTLRAT